MPNYLNPSVSVKRPTDWGQFGQGMANLFSGAGKIVDEVTYGKGMKAGMGMFAEQFPEFSVPGATSVEMPPRTQTAKNFLGGSTSETADPVIELTEEESLPPAVREQVKRTQAAARYTQAQQNMADPEGQAVNTKINELLQEAWAEYAKSTGPDHAQKLMKARMIAVQTGLRFHNPRVTEDLMKQVVTPMAEGAASSEKQASANLMKLLQMQNSYMQYHSGLINRQQLQDAMIAFRGRELGVTVGRKAADAAVKVESAEKDRVSRDLRELRKERANLVKDWNKTRDDISFSSLSRKDQKERQLDHESELNRLNQEILDREEMLKTGAPGAGGGTGGTVKMKDSKGKIFNIPVDQVAAAMEHETYPLTVVDE